ncbi:MAG: tyrosine--tRNA ligase [Parcubacteria group bacterium]|nr:tyrosine--tRNA ligase [Parcubacteria group bacterium]
MDEKEIRSILDTIFSRGVTEWVDPENVLRKKLEAKMRGEYEGKIIVKFGVDPTRPDIHLGHAVVLRKLRALQDIGCTVVFLVGDFTAKIGDPSGKSKVRPEIDQREVEVNMQTYLDQVGKVLSTKPEVFSWIRNSDWFLSVSDMEPKKGLLMRLGVTPINPRSFLGKALLFENTRMQKKIGKKEIMNITMRGMIATLRHITHSRLLERDMFQERIKSEKELYMHEVMYPVLQGIDSVVLSRIYGSCDVEIGGSDQFFNMHVGRDVMKVNGIEQQAVVAMDILVGTEGKEKMSKSLDNYIAITESPVDMFGKVMSVPDGAIEQYFTLTTFTPPKDVEDIVRGMKKGTVNPKDAKLSLAHQIVAIYHGTLAADTAREIFISTFSKKEIPEEVEEITAQKGEKLVDILAQRGFANSKSDARRLVTQGGVHILETKETVTSIDMVIETTHTYRIGKHRFVRIVVG